jgi:hypothetical protein
VAEHLVDHHFQAQCVRAFQQSVEVGQGAEQRIHIAVVGDVVAEVRHRRLEERRDPDRVHAQAGDVAKPLHDPRQVADTIAIGVEETARIDLVHDGAAPPLFRSHRRPGLSRNQPRICRACRRLRRDCGMRVR